MQRVARKPKPRRKSAIVARTVQSPPIMQNHNDRIERVLYLQRTIGNQATQQLLQREETSVDEANPETEQLNWLDMSMSERDMRWAALSEAEREQVIDDAPVEQRNVLYGLMSKKDLKKRQKKGDKAAFKTVHARLDKLENESIPGLRKALKAGDIQEARLHLGYIKRNPIAVYAGTMKQFMSIHFRGLISFKIKKLKMIRIYQRFLSVNHQALSIVDQYHKKFSHKLKKMEKKGNSGILMQAQKQQAQDLIDLLDTFYAKREEAKHAQKVQKEYKSPHKSTKKDSEHEAIRNRRY